jgi:lipopolysaccharide transport system permease protein
MTHPKNSTVATSPELPPVAVIGPSLEIDAHPKDLRADLAEIWAYRDLLFMLIQRDISIRYKQSALGIGWAVLQPLVMMAIFSTVFGLFAKLPSEGIPYPLFTLSALLPWMYFSRALAGTSESLVGAAHLIQKIYFPRLILPLSKAFAGLVDLAVAFVLFVLLEAWYGLPPSWGILWLPVLVLIAFVTALGLGIWLAALNVQYRDVGIIVPFALQIWMYISPIAYSATIVPEKWRWLYNLNPLAGVIQGFRWALLGCEPPDLGAMAISLGVIVVLLVAGVARFRHTERLFADVI